jgi:hypothetical protein
VRHAWLGIDGQLRGGMRRIFPLACLALLVLSQPFAGIGTFAQAQALTASLSAGLGEELTEEVVVGELDTEQAADLSDLLEPYEYEEMGACCACMGSELCTCGQIGLIIEELQDETALNAPAEARAETLTAAEVADEKPVEIPGKIDNPASVYVLINQTGEDVKDVEFKIIVDGKEEEKQKFDLKKGGGKIIAFKTDYSTVKKVEYKITCGGKYEVAVYTWIDAKMEWEKLNGDKVEGTRPLKGIVLNPEKKDK